MNTFACMAGGQRQRQRRLTDRTKARKLTLLTCAQLQAPQVHQQRDLTFKLFELKNNNVLVKQGEVCGSFQNTLWAVSNRTYSYLNNGIILSLFVWNSRSFEFSSFERVPSSHSCAVVIWKSNAEREGLKNGITRLDFTYLHTGSPPFRNGPLKSTPETPKSKTRKEENKKWS